MERFGATFKFENPVDFSNTQTDYMNFAFVFLFENPVDFSNTQTLNHSEL